MSWIDDRSGVSSVAGKSCDRCGFDEAATSFLDINEPTSLRGSTFCNRCGSVYDHEHRLLLAETEQFYDLGRPGFDGSGKLWDPGESFDDDDQVPPVTQVNKACPKPSTPPSSRKKSSATETGSDRDGNSR